MKSLYGKIKGKDRATLVKAYYKNKDFRQYLKKMGLQTFGRTLSIMGCCEYEVVVTPLDGAVQNLGVGAYYTLMARDTITNLGVTNVYGIVNSSSIGGPGVILDPTAPSGDSGPSGSEGSKLEADTAEAQTVYDAFLNGFDNLKTLTGTNLSGIDLATSGTLQPGVYTYNATCTLTGLLSLDGLHDPNAQWVFIIGTTFGTSAGSEIRMIHDGRGANVYWIIESASTIGANTMLKGNVLASNAITFGNGASLVGRLLANAISLDNNQISYKD